jgi:DNA-binding CsgD family transcriptional regulator
MRPAEPAQQIQFTTWLAAAARRVRSLTPVASLTLIGIALGVVISSVAVQLVESRLTDLLLSQAAARASDQVALAIQERVSAADFASANSPDQLAEFHARLAPTLGRVRADGTGVLGVSLVSRDGTVVYADAPSREGRPMPSVDRPLLAAALSGRTGTAQQAISSRTDMESTAPFDSVLTVYVPVVVDGGIVGAYALDQAPLVLGPAGLLARVLGGVVLGLIFHLAARAVAAQHVRPSGPLRPRPDASVVDKRRQKATREEHGKNQTLTNREMEVLKLLATRSTYQEMAAHLVVSEETVRSHVKHVLHKLGQPSRTLAVVAALQGGLLDLP